MAEKTELLPWKRCNTRDGGCDSPSFCAHEQRCQSPGIIIDTLQEARIFITNYADQRYGVKAFEVTKKIDEAIAAWNRRAVAEGSAGKDTQSSGLHPEGRNAALEEAAKVAEADYTPGYGPHRADMEDLAERQRRDIAERIRALREERE